MQVMMQCHDQKGSLNGAIKKLFLGKCFCSVPRLLTQTKALSSLTKLRHSINICYKLIYVDMIRWIQVKHERWKLIMKYCFNRLSIFSLIVLFILMNLCDHSLFYEVEPGITSTSPCDRSMKIQPIINSHSLGNDVKSFVSLHRLTDGATMTFMSMSII